MGEPSLIESGIAKEQSDWRCHVGFATGRAYFFKTSAVAGLDMSKFRTGKARSNGGRYGLTAVGKLVPVESIPGAVCVMLPQRWLNDLFLNWEKYSCATERQLGVLAQDVAIEIINSGKAPVSGNVSIVTDRQRQLSGYDLLVGESVVQVKCDFAAGPKEQGGTGNIYMEIASRNPSRQR